MKNQVFKINKTGEYEFILPFKKRGESGNLLGVIQAMKPGEYQVRVEADHLVAETNGRVEVRGVVANGARVNLTGLIKIAPGAVKTDSFLDLKLLMLDNKSYAMAEPELEILNNEVKASHKASVGRIDKEQLYYLASRGISEKEAVGLIVSGFLGVIDTGTANNLE